MNPMRARWVSSGMVLALAALLTGCGDFWQAPGSSSTSTGTTATTTTLTPSTTTPTEGASVTLTATVSPTAATGTVTFYDGSASIGSETLTSGTATLATSFTTTGAQSLTATYGGSSTYASSTSDPVSVTVSAASSSSARVGTGSAAKTATTVAKPQTTNVTTTVQGAAAIHAIEPFSSSGGNITAQDAEAVVVDSGGSVAVKDVTLRSAAGNGRGVLLESRTSTPDGTANAPQKARFTMTGGSLTYSCGGCADGVAAPGRTAPATVFAVASTAAEIVLTDAAVTNNTATADNRQGTLLTVAGLRDGRSLAFTARGTALAGNVVADAASPVALSLLADDAGTGSSLTGAVNSSQSGRAVSLTLDASSLWTVTGSSSLGTLSGLDITGGTVNNIDGGGHCVFYSGSVNGAGSRAIYALSGGGFLAPAGTAGLNCQ